MPSFSSGKKDFIIIALLLISALAVWGAFALFDRTNERRGVYAEIIYDGELAETVYLSDDNVFAIKELPSVIFEVRDGKIAFIESDCPDKVCIKTGRLDSGGDFAACLPNKALLRVIDEESDSGVDAVAR